MLGTRPARQSKKFFASWHKSRSILLLADEARLPEIGAFIKKAEQEQKALTVAFVYKGKQAPACAHKHLAISKKEFGFFKLPKDEVLSKLNASTFDVLINLGEEKELDLLALSKLTDASCKIARYEHPVFDISISAGTPIGNAEYLEQVYTYLNMIKND